ncbi:universal stress protein [Streptomyces sp. CRN 30]|uniref:universal stress protein n=1 Tax=Streptomyces sp. CRN 30 TaxID=3075613 RepID=UPI002A7F02A5|nr:universal stress protein [Streptomyces sp. CRN 30]
MPRLITVGIDDSPESRAAAEWAAREAALRDLPVRLLHVRQPVPQPASRAPLLGGETRQHWNERTPRDAAEGLALRHPGAEVIMEQRVGAPAAVLVEAARDAEMLVLGSRALSGLGGLLLGSVAQSVVGRTTTPVILVRAGEQAADEHVMDPAGVPSAATPFRPLVLGVDTERPDDTLLAFAFEEARRRRCSLHAVHGWHLPSAYPYALAAGAVLNGEMARRQAAVLTGTLRPWQRKFPDVGVGRISRLDSPSHLLVETARDASLVVVGRRVRRGRLGAHIGTVAHAVLQHSTAPVAVVAHE